MSGDRDEVPIRCPACETQTAIDIDDVDEKLQRHNEQRHDGVVVAGVPVRTGDGVELLPAPETLGEMIDSVVGGDANAE